MKNLTKSLSLVLALVLVLSCVGCAGTNETVETTQTETIPVGESTETTEVPVVEETVPETIVPETTEPVVEETIPETIPETAPVETAPAESEQEVIEQTVPETQPEATEPVVKFTSVNETVYATTDVNVRSGAGTEYDKVGRLEAGESVTRIGVGDNGWSKVTYNGKTSYIASNYLTKTKPVEKPTEPVHTHSYVLTEVEPTCTKGGYVLYACACGDSYKANETGAIGHDYKTETVAPTTTSQGYDIHTCKSCGDTFKDNYKDKIPEETVKPTEPVHTHNYDSKVTAATCENDGYTTYKCACGDSYTGNYTEATGHNYKVETVAPTTDSKGYDIHTCKTCGDSYKDNYTDKLVEEKPSGPIHTNSSVYNTLIGFKSKYPEGMAFDNSVNYSWSCPYNGSVIFYSESGCTAFASELSHAAFGVKEYATLYNITINDVRVGDILRINGGAHTVIVLEVYADHVVIAEANYGGKVHWGRTLTAEQVANASCLISRYSDRL